MIETPPAPAEDLAAAERMAACLAQLEALAEVGMVLARRLQSEVEAAGPGETDFAVVALAFSRIAKAVRMSIALHARLDAAGFAAMTPSARPDKAVGAEQRAVEQDAPEDESHEREVHEREVLGERPERERLNERLENPNELGDRPMAEIVAEICGALGVEPDLRLWLEPDEATRDVRTKSPGAICAKAATDTTQPAFKGALRLILERPPP